MSLAGGALIGASSAVGPLLAPGVDRVTLAAIEAHGVKRLLGEVQGALRAVGRVEEHRSVLSVAGLAGGSRCTGAPRPRLRARG